MPGMTMPNVWWALWPAPGRSGPLASSVTHRGEPSTASLMIRGIPSVTRDTLTHPLACLVWLKLSMLQASNLGSSSAEFVASR